jgi:hypothetical protein
LRNAKIPRCRSHHEFSDTPYDNLMTIYCQYTVRNFSTMIIMQESIK